MTITDLQQRLIGAGYTSVVADGDYGEETRKALMALLESGPDTPIMPSDVLRAASLVGATPAHIRTVRDVEAAGAGFADGLPKILFEGHIFSKLTNNRFDRSNPRVSYPKWDKTKYPRTQQGRYDQLLEAVGLDPASAFSAASYGAFQILGQNFRICGFMTPFDFVLAMSQTEGSQLFAFVNFVKGNRLDDALRNGRWAEFARGYNGSAYKANQYDVKLAQAFAHEQAMDRAGVLSGTCRITDKINLRASPGGAVLGVIDAGGYVNVIKDHGEWAEVNYAPGKVGFVAKRYLAKV